MTDASTLTKSIDADGAGGSALSPELQLLMTGALRALFARYGFPVANARIEDVQDLLGGALFLPLYKWMLEVRFCVTCAFVLSACSPKRPPLQLC